MCKVLHICLFTVPLDGQDEPQSPKKNFQVAGQRALPVSCRAAHTHRAYHGVRGELSATHLPPSTASNPRPPGTRLWTRLQLPPIRPAKSRISRNRRGCRGPGMSELLRVRQPPHLSLKHTPGPRAAACVTRQPPPPPTGTRVAALSGRPASRGKVLRRTLLNRPCAVVLSPLRPRGCASAARLGRGCAPRVPVGGRLWGSGSGERAAT